MSKLRFIKISAGDIAVRTRKDNSIGSIMLKPDRKWGFMSYDNEIISGRHMVEIGEYMLRLANPPKTDDSGPVVTGTLKVEKPHTMTPGFVAHEPKVAAFTTGPDGKVTVAYDVREPGTVTQYATAASSRMVMPGTASIRFVCEGRDYTLDITGVIVGENASVELRQENDTWSL